MKRLTTKSAALIAILVAGIGLIAGTAHAETTHTITLVSGDGELRDPNTQFTLDGGATGQDAFIDPPIGLYLVIPGTQYVTSKAGQLTTTRYRTAFELPAFFRSPSLEIQIHADNHATMFLNGTEVGRQETITGCIVCRINFQDPVETFTVSDASLLNAGQNVLEFDVSNGPDVPGGENPTALDYKVVVSYSGYDFTGFSGPVNNPPTFNAAKSGGAVPAKFSLSGDQGLDIFTAGFPKSQESPCESSAPVDGIEETVAAGGSSLSYDATADQYKYVWKTDKAWAGTCRQLVVKLNDGSFQRANFQFD